MIVFPMVFQLLLDAVFDSSFPVFMGRSYVERAGGVCNKHPTRLSTHAESADLVAIVETCPRPWELTD